MSFIIINEGTYIYLTQQRRTVLAVFFFAKKKPTLSSIQFWRKKIRAKNKRKNLVLIVRSSKKYYVLKVNSGVKESSIYNRLYGENLFRTLI